MRFPTDLQSCILFEEPLDRFDIVVAKVRESLASMGLSYNVVEHRPGEVLQMFGNDTMVRFEHVAHQADRTVFQRTLASPFTRFMADDAEARIAAHRAHVLVTVQLGAMGGNEIQAMLAKMGMDVPGNSLGAFTRLLDHLEVLTSFFSLLPGALLVHWVQSDQLYRPDSFREVAKEGIPGLLHIHPFIFQAGSDASGEDLAEIMSFGVRHFLGREVEVAASPVPWFDSWRAIQTFVRVATMANGYLVPHGDCFGDEDRTQSFRVLHLPEEEGQVPLYRLVPLFHRASGFQAPDYVPDERGIDTRRPPEQVMPRDPQTREELEALWAEKRAMVEGIGGALNVKVAGEQPLPPAGTNRLGRIFGRKR